MFAKCRIPKKYRLWIPVLCLALILCACGQAIDVSLSYQGNPTTGYSWIYTVADEGIVQVDVAESNQNDPNLVGASVTTYAYTLRGLSAGETQVVFRYEQPWETDSVAEIHTFRVRVNGGHNVTAEEILPEARIDLTYNPGAGYHWQAEECGECVKVLNPIVDASPDGKVGSETTAHFPLYALSEGTCSVVFGLYAPAGEVPEETVTYTVTVGADGAVTITPGNAG